MMLKETERSNSWICRVRGQQPEGGRGWAGSQQQYASYAGHVDHMLWIVLTCRLNRDGARRGVFGNSAVSGQNCLTSFAQVGRKRGGGGGGGER
eukprot:755226-Hanusia_phi.AAC.2